MAVQAKFRCNVKKITDYGNMSNDRPVEVEFSAVYGKTNEPWSKATPSGRLTMLITNPDASEWFEPGQDYMLTFTEAPAE